MATTFQQRETLLNRFFSYIAFDTQSRPDAQKSPSSIGQLRLAEQLVEELEQLGLAEIKLSRYGIVTALLPSNCGSKKTIGFIAHLDTSPQMSGKNVKAELIQEYRGGDIALGKGDDYISPVDYHFLRQLVGDSLIVTDGNTLLGADNKAGIAEIMTALEQLIDSKMPHANIRLAFTPDEEIGLGMDFFPFADFACDWAYTIDGGELGELQVENFNAAGVQILIQGRSAHPGEAKDKMINALALACDFHQYLPKDEVPEKTAGREGFFHLDKIEGDVEQVRMHYLIREFDAQRFKIRKQQFHQWAEEFADKHGLQQRFHCEITDNYKNMYEVISKVPQALELAKNAMRDCGITPLEKPIRGGTDGAKLAIMGIACPNIFTGGYNFHSKYELASVQSMQSAVDVIVKIAVLAA
ncbi:peptidase T. Metallo peptidase. MEROPS family M20B [Pasteurella testudinis DSM 23072]|uniref:Peptidase T n=1 Tax=Pasteurella testudinis DSM 23072 TaxID=1122938 RepID=A0A1W1V9Z8_9PAST|nr:peptidase T [Pasteurella testudinis]SMB90086.1 peptidase T. Metallo peptidase. MEROPS family M20B [Pasteurella testudinis DSM 23072]SUB51328.1 peptidase T [Pasteurella testudinis]